MTKEEKGRDGILGIFFVLGVYSLMRTLFMNIPYFLRVLNLDQIDFNFYTLLFLLIIPFILACLLFKRYIQVSKTFDIYFYTTLVLELIVIFLNYYILYGVI